MLLILKIVLGQPDRISEIKGLSKSNFLLCIALCLSPGRRAQQNKLCKLVTKSKEIFQFANSYRQPQMKTLWCSYMHAIGGPPSYPSSLLFRLTQLCCHLRGGTGGLPQSTHVHLCTIMQSCTERGRHFAMDLIVCKLPGRLITCVWQSMEHLSLCLVDNLALFTNCIIQFLSVQILHALEQSAHNPDPNFGHPSPCPR